VEIYRAQELNEITPMMSINRIARSGHEFLYDYETLKYMLQETLFCDIKQESFKSGRDPMLWQDSEHRIPESLYVEASKPW